MEITTATLPRRALKLLTYPESVVVLLLPVAWIVSTHLSHYFSLPYMFNLSYLYVETGIMALTMTFIIISGNIDLSVASNLCLTGVICAKLYHEGILPMPAVVVLAPIIGGLLGFFNGALIAFLRLPSLTVTLGTLALYRGLAQVIVPDQYSVTFPAWFSDFGQYSVGNVIPVQLLLWLVLAIVAGVVLAKTTFGRRVYAIGTNEPAARFAGIRVRGYKLMLFTLSGVISGVCSMLWYMRRPSPSYTMAHDECCSELAVITVVVLGGTDIFGGRGTIFGTSAALVLLAVVSRGMGMAYIPPTTQLTVTGSLLIAAVVLFRLLRNLAQK